MADAIVVGGGVVGTSVLYHLVAEGLSEVQLLERGALADGASGKTAGLVQLNACRHEAEARLAFESTAYYRDWSEVVGAGSCGFVKTGYIRLEPAGAEAALRERVERDRLFGWDSQVLDAGDVTRVAPYVRSDDVGIAVHEPEAGYADGTATACGFAERAIQLGADVELGAEVIAIEHTGGRVRGVRTKSGVVEAPIVVVAAGAGSAALLHTVGLDVPVAPVLTRTATFRWVDGKRPALAHVGDVRNGSYLRPDGDDRVVVGVSPLARTSLPDDPATFDSIAEDYIEACRSRLVDRIPTAAGVVSLGGRGGPIGLSPDALPIVDAHPGIEGLFFAAADVGSTFKIAPALGRALAIWATTGAVSPAVDALRLSRFVSVRRPADLFAVHADYFTFGGVLPAAEDLQGLTGHI